MDILNWTNKKETIDIDTQAGTSLHHWALPFSFIVFWGKHNKNFDFSNEGSEVKFKDIPSIGWYFNLTIQFLCFWVEIDFNRWYDGKN